MRIVQNILIMVNVVLIIYFVYSICNIRLEGFHIGNGNAHNHYDDDEDDNNKQINNGYEIASGGV